jgi:predicted nucleic acid-binding protein
MKPYWDASALIQTHLDEELHIRLKQAGAVTRTHSLSEMFSTLTGGRVALRLEANDAAKSIENIVKHLEFVDLTGDEVVQALKKARSRGVRGGRVHDYLHALAAQKAKADALLTTDRNDFDGLVPGLSVEQV